MSSNKGLMGVAIAAIFLVIAMYVGDFLLAAFLHMPIEKVPAVVKFATHGVTLTILAVAAMKIFKK